MLRTERINLQSEEIGRFIGEMEQSSCLNKNLTGNPVNQAS